jgi:hypothetical protein
MSDVGDMWTHKCHTGLVTLFHPECSNCGKREPMGDGIVGNECQDERFQTMEARIKKLEAAIKLHRQVHSSPDISADWFDGRLWKALEAGNE